LPSLLFNYFWPGMVVWSLLYISDYSLTIACARLYRAQQTILFEGSYEITPFFQRDIDSLRGLSPRFVFMLLLTLGMLGFLWILNEQSPAPELWQFVLGCLIIVQLAVHTRHLRNLFLFRSINNTNLVHGRIKYARTLVLRMSSLECFAFSGLFLILFAFTRSWFILGGVTGCFLLGVNHLKLARRLHKNLARVTQSPEQM
jgi:hypothetical protein